MRAIVADILLALGGSFAAALLLKATVVLAVALVAAGLARRARAAVRHLVLAAAFVVLLGLPLASLVIPARVVRVAAPVVTAPPPAAIVPFFVDAPPARPVLPAATAPEPALASAVSIGVLLAIVWALGAVACLLPILAGLWQTRSLRRSGAAWPRGAGFVRGLSSEARLRRRVLVLLHESVPGPMTCGFVRPAILLPLEVERWSDDDVRRALIHELEHVRRGDWALHCLARVTCAAYWFHPLVWVAWSRLRLEAERACDDAVLRHAEPAAYADQLVVLAERLATANTRPLLAMAARRDLSTRVRAVLDSAQARGNAGAAAVVATAIAASALTVTLSPLQAVRAPSGIAIGHQSAVEDAPVEVLAIEHVEPLTADTPDLSAVALAKVEPNAQAAQDPAPSATPAFEVASIRRNTSGGVPRMRVEGGRLVASNTSLLELIRDAYRLQSFQVIGGPEWLRAAPGPNRAAPASQRPGEVTFDIVANIPQNTAPTQVPVMVRTLLAQRFNLVLHTEMRDMPVYVLTFTRDDARLGPQLTRSSQQCEAEIQGGPLRAPVTRVSEDGTPVCGMMMGPARIRGGGLTMTFLANALTGFAQRLVVDRTGLEGPFDWHLTYAPAARGGGPALSDDRPSIFTAVQEQLGLKLESATAPVEVLVIDSVSMPTEN